MVNDNHLWKNKPEVSPQKPRPVPAFWPKINSQADVLRITCRVRVCPWFYCEWGVVLTAAARDPLVGMENQNCYSLTLFSLVFMEPDWFFDNFHFYALPKWSYILSWLMGSCFPPWLSFCLVLIQLFGIPTRSARFLEPIFLLNVWFWAETWSLHS